MTDKTGLRFIRAEEHNDGKEGRCAVAAWVRYIGVDVDATVAVRQGAHCDWPQRTTITNR